MENSNILASLKGKLIVSCQALSNEPLYSPEALLLMAKAAIQGGAAALRANSPLSIRQMKHFYDIPVIGLYKKDYPDSEIYITPTLKEVESIALSGADIIATDATGRKRPGEVPLKAIVDSIHSYGLLAMADISNYEEGLEAQRLGFDLVGTTLSGYTPYTPKMEEPDFELLSKLTANLKIPVIMEGRLWEPGQVKEAFDRKAYAVVVGSSITRPKLITERFTKIL